MITRGATNCKSTIPYSSKFYNPFLYIEIMHPHLIKNNLLNIILNKESNI